MLADATSAYRGYRLQLLYTLHRLLDPESEGRMFQLEGIEDLDIYDVDGRLLELVQVKAYGEPLALSHLASKDRQEGSVVHRAAPLLRSSVVPRVSVASFGPIGSELELGLAGRDKEHNNLSQKLVLNYHLSIDSAETMLKMMRVERLEEEQLREEIFQFLEESVAAADPESAFDLLSHWLYGCEERHLNPDLLEALADEFYRGVGARYEHILANLDAPRPEPFGRIASAFTDRNAVVLHAASGQGKSTLAYRYLRDALPHAWRYLVRVVEGRAHGQVIATALEGYADALQVPIAVFIDVSSSDVGWPELVERLARHPDIRVLVGVREEDWRRATFGDSEAIRDVDLTFSRAEAEQVFHSLAATRASTAYLDFDAAWSRFGNGGPLLEFVYLITQGGLLRDRLETQVNRLKDEANRSDGGVELRLLRLVAVAAAYGGRLSVKRVAEHLQLPALDRVITILEDEYLVRRAERGALLDGLHPIRSVILVDLLTDPDTAPWGEIAAADLKLIDERDLGSFLLHAFSRHVVEIGPLLEALAGFQPSGWVGTAGALRALVWLGLTEYVKANRALIAEARSDSGNGWSVVLDTDIADAMPGIAEATADLIGNVASEQRRRRVEALRTRQTAKDGALDRALTWLRARTLSPRAPSSVEEWASAAEVTFWVRRLVIDWPISEWLPLELITKPDLELPLNAIADVVAGCASHDDPETSAWLTSIRPLLKERFQRELMSPVLEIDDDRIEAHFILDFAKPVGEPTEAVAMPFLDSRNPLHNEALIRIDLMRRLFPDLRIFACQGYGHGVGTLELPNDDTRKTGIPIERLPLPWLTSVNATFLGIVDYDSRPADWKEYAEQVVGLREEVTRCLEDLSRALPDYLTSAKSAMLLGRSIPSEEWIRRWKILREPPLLPKCAVDEWGFVSETSVEATTEQERVQGRTGLSNIPTVRHYRPLIEPLREYTTAWHNFLLQAPKVMTANQGVRKGGKAGPGNPSRSRADDPIRKLSTHQLAKAWNVLPGLQMQQRRILGGLVDDKRLKSLEIREVEQFAGIWPLWYAFALEPERVLRNPFQETAEWLARIGRRLDKAVRRVLSSLPLDAINVSMISSDSTWDGEPVLWLTMDGIDGVAVHNALQQVLEAVRHALTSIEDSPLRLHALNFCLRHVVVIPLIRGRSLSGTAYRMPTNLLIQVNHVDELGFWHFVPHSMPVEALTGLGLTVWNDPRLAPAIELSEAVFHLWRVVGHVQELANLPELHGIGEEVGLRHAERMFDRVQAVLQQTMDAAGQLARTVGTAAPVMPKAQSHLAVVIEALQALSTAALPTDSTNSTDSTDSRVTLTLQVHEFRSWAERLQEALGHGYVAQLAWASAVLMYKNDSTT